MMKGLWIFLALCTVAACGGQSGTTPTDETYTTAGDDEPPEQDEDDPY